MTDPLPPPFRFRTGRLVVLGLLAVNLLAIGAAWRVLSLSRKDKIQEAAQNAANLAHVIGENLEGTFRLIDLALEDALGDVTETSATGKPLGEPLDHHLARLNAQIGFTDGIRMANAAGLVVRGSGLPPGAPIDVSDREYFIRARDGDPEALTIASPVQSRITGKRVVAFARRISAADGAFMGVVYAPVAIDRLAQGLLQVNVGSTGAIVLRSRDHTLVARHPPLPGPLSAAEERRVSPQLAAVLESGVTEATYTATSPVDGIVKVNAFRSVQGGDFILLVALPRDEQLAGWRAEVQRTAIGVVIFVLITTLLGFSTIRSWRREAGARFRTLVEGAPIAITMARGGRVLYVNEAFVRNMRLPKAEAAIGRSILDSMGPDDAARTAERWERLARHLPVEPTVELTLRRPDGGSFLAAITDAAVDLDDGPAIMGFVQDVTERKRFDEERERLIGDLKRALADVKTLSGLLPICAHCKKVRDDRGYWSRIETYIRERSHAEFTHGICPDCAREFFGEDGGEDGGGNGGAGDPPA